MKPVVFLCFLRPSRPPLSSVLEYLVPTLHTAFKSILTRMFLVRAPNRGWGLITASGMYAEFATGPRTCHFDGGGVTDLDGDDGALTPTSAGVAAGGSPSGRATKSPTPMSGKHVIVGATSPGRSTLRMRLRRRRMLRSTLAVTPVGAVWVWTWSKGWRPNGGAISTVNQTFVGLYS